MRLPVVQTSLRSMTQKHQAVDARDEARPLTIGSPIEQFSQPRAFRGMRRAPSVRLNGDLNALPQEMLDVYLRQ